MTTDRPAVAPSRNTASAQRSSSSPANRGQQAPPSDAFSAMLAAQPQADQKAQPRSKDAQQPKHDEHRRADGPKASRKPVKTDDTAPQADDTAAATTTQPSDDDATQTPRPVTPSIFALQLAGPLPTPQNAPAPTAAAPTDAQPVAAPALPPQLAGPLPTLPAAPPVDPNAQPQPQPQQQPVDPNAAQQPQQPAPPTPPVDAGQPGGIPLPDLAGLKPPTGDDAKIDLPKPTADQPQAPAPAPDQPAAPQPNNAPQTQADSQGQPNPQPQADQTKPVATAKPAEQPQAPTVTAQPVAVQPPVAQAPISAPTGLQRQIPLYRAVETTGAMIQMAAQKGVTHARLNLKPVELGGIEVRLQSTSEGVIAKLVADSPQAAKMLDQASDDLKRSLEEKNVNLLSLEVSTSNGDQRNDQPGFTAFAEGFGEQTGPGSARGARRTRSTADTGVVEAAAGAEKNLVLPNGVLVDVLA